MRDAPSDVSRWLNEHAELHPNLRIVVASRKDDERLHTLSAIHADSLTTLNSSRNAAPDVTSYAGKVAAKPHVQRVLREYGVQPEEFARRAAAKADVVFQYVAFLDRALAAAAAEGPHPADLDWLAAPTDEWPNGPGELYTKFMARIRDQVKRVTLTAPAWDAIYRPLLGLLAVAYAPLATAQLAAYAGISDEQATTCEGALARLSQFVAGGPDAGYTLVHRSVAEYIVDPETEPSLGRDDSTAHRQITGYAFGRYGAGHSWKAADAYLRTFLAAHAAAVGQLDDLVEDPWFLVAADPEELLATLENAVRAAPVAAVYRRVAPDLKRRDESAALAHLELIAREAGLDEFAAAVAGMTGDRPWTTAWTRRERIRVSGVLGRHEGGITAIAVTPADIDGGGSLALTAGNDGRIRIWDPRRHAEVEPPLTPRETDSKIMALAAGKLRSGQAFAAAGTFAGLVRAWNVATREPVCPPLGRRRERWLPQGRLRSWRWPGDDGVRRALRGARQPAGMGCHARGAARAAGADRRHPHPGCRAGVRRTPAGGARGDRRRQRRDGTGLRRHDMAARQSPPGNRGRGGHGDCPRGTRGQACRGGQGHLAWRPGLRRGNRHAVA